MSLDIRKGAKASFVILQGKYKGIVIPLQFNPSSYSVVDENNFSEKKLMGLKGSIQQFTGTKQSDFSLEFIFDSTSTGVDVRGLMLPLQMIIDIDNELHAPPPCKFVWGSFLFNGIVSTFKKEFTFFFASGIPARVKISMTLKPYVIAQEMAQLLGLQSSDISKKRMLVEGDSIFSIAHREYKDPAMWRSIAQKNDIENPLFIKPGSTLLLPPKEDGNETS